jgi:hypothetical protein
MPDGGLEFPLVESLVVCCSVDGFRGYRNAAIG